MAFKKLLNITEKITHDSLLRICKNYGVGVFPKVRVADVLPIENSGISNELYKYALQAHFDFVITEQDHELLFGVEFDGQSHQGDKQKERDNKKNKICEIFDFPLLRITSEHLQNKYQKFDLLSWFLLMWFTRRDFLRAREAGEMRSDESFSRQNIVEIEGVDEKFPLLWSAKIRIHIRKLVEAKIIDDYPKEKIGFDSQGNCFGIGWHYLKDGVGVIAEARLKSQKFPIPQNDIMRDMIARILFDRLIDVLENHASGTSSEIINEKIRDFEKKALTPFDFSNPKAYLL